MGERRKKLPQNKTKKPQNKQIKLGIQLDYVNILNFNSLLKRFFQHLKSYTEV